MFKTKEEKEKAEAEKLEADKKAAAKKLEAEKKDAAKKLEADCLGKDLKIILSNGARFEGLCTSVRKINGGAQVFLQLNGLVSRYFNAEDIVK